MNEKNPLPVVEEKAPSKRLPKWLHRNLPKGGKLFQTSAILRKYGLHTVCEEAKCPNRFRCFAEHQTATFLLLGKSCTRSCGFCDIQFTKAPPLPDSEEPKNTALSVKELKLKHAVITMVARDDLADGGAEHIAKTIREIRRYNPQTTVEVLTSDFLGCSSSLAIVLNEKPEIFNHNIETVERLSGKIRHRANYARTLEVLKRAKASKKRIS